MRWVVATGALAGTWLFGSVALAQYPANTRAMPDESAEEAAFDEGVARELKLIEFAHRLQAEHAAEEAQTFEQGVARYLKAVNFMRLLEEQREAAVEAAFDVEIALASRVMKVMQHLDTQHTLVPEPVDWIRGPREPSSGAR